MKPFRSRTYEYNAADWKQVVRDPKSAAILRSPYTKFTWSLPETDRFHVSYDPIWCFIGYRRLYIQPPYPHHPLINILGADLNEIHGVHYFPILGEYTKSLRFKKARAIVPGYEQELEASDETHNFNSE